MTEAQGSAPTPAEDLGIGRSARAAERAFVDSLRVETPRVWVMWVAMAANVIVLGVQVAFGVSWIWPTSESMVAWGALYGRMVGEAPWRLATSMFLHFGVLHLVSNVFALWLVGGAAERSLGNARFAAIDLASGLLAGVTSTWLFPDVAGLGASGAVLGIYGALFLELGVRGARIPLVARRRLWMKAVLVTGLTLAPGIALRELSFAVHLVGLVAGFVLAWIARPRARDDARIRVARRVAPVAIIVLTIVSPLVVAPATQAPMLVELERSRSVANAILEDYDAAVRRAQADEIDNLAFADIVATEVLPRWNAEIAAARASENDGSFAEERARWLRFLDSYAFALGLVVDGYRANDDKKVQDGFTAMEAARAALEKPTESW